MPSQLVFAVIATPNRSLLNASLSRAMESPEGSNDLYSLLKLGRDATEEEIHRAYKALSTTFHPDKLPPQTAQERREQIQQVFLEFKRARK